MILQKVISGGQPGAERAGLEAAKANNIATGGIAPEGYITIFGRDYGLAYLGLESPSGLTYPQRTQNNIDNSSGTIVFRNKSSPLADAAVAYCHCKIWNPKYTNIFSKLDGHRPVFVVSGEQLKNKQQWPSLVQQLIDFIVGNKLKILNVAGNRQGTCGMLDFALLIEALLYRVFCSIISNVTQ